MKKKLLIRILLGFLLGMAAMLLVPAILNGIPVGTGLYSDKLLARTGSPEAATVLSLLVMLLIKRNPAVGALAVSGLGAAGVAWLLARGVTLRGDMLWCVILLCAACAAGVAVFLFVRQNPENGVIGTSMIGAVFFNIGQTLMAVAVMRTPQLLYTYLPFLVAMGAVVGSLTGIVARRVFLALRALPSKR